MLQNFPSMKQEVHSSISDQLIWLWGDLEINHNFATYVAPIHRGQCLWKMGICEFFVASLHSSSEPVNVMGREHTDDLKHLLTLEFSQCLLGAYLLHGCYLCVSYLIYSMPSISWADIRIDVLLEQFNSVLIYLPKVSTLKLLSFSKHCLLLSISICNTILNETHSLKFVTLYLIFLTFWEQAIQKKM